MAEKKISKEIQVYPADHADEALRGQPTGLIVWTFPDETKETFDLTKVNDGIKVRLSLHGASQKVGDSYAGAAQSGVDPIEYAKQAVKDTIAQLYAGDWRAASAVGGPRVNDLAVALSRVTGEPLEGDEGTIALVAAMTDEDKKVYRKKPKIAAALALIAAERAAAKAAELVKKAEEEDKKEAATA